MKAFIMLSVLLISLKSSATTIRVTIANSDGSFTRDFSSQAAADAFKAADSRDFAFRHPTYSSTDISADVASYGSAIATFQGLKNKTSFTASDIQAALTALVNIQTKSH